ncbi:electron transfer flavoprotein subunit alpha, mitochondrial [Phalaenopsis equestris]|uniref:electron transfer flavoprotein subunit alpha, mitochondrial n=1 Tax=Phalaenopsis equestris TaxID=78828 RepID=UPI0009E4764E|nr:electron transfer flavoprotein subunit alpha, mitochondrial [Phalaenopsis equestris]
MASLAIFRALRNRRFSSISPSAIPCSRSFSRLISTLVLGEHEGGFLKPSTLSAISAASSIGKDNSISVLLGGFGSDLKKAATHAASARPVISQVLVADADILTHSLAESWADLVYLLQKEGDYSYIISASSSFGKNVLPRAAALLDVSPITDVIEISEPHLFVRPIYAGNALCMVRYTGLDPCVMTIRPTSFAPPAIPSEVDSNAAPISQVDLSTFNKETQRKSWWLKLTSQETDLPDLGNARIVVTGGRGLKSAENFKLLEKLAEKLGAAVGATRAAVDANFVPNDLQIGQTGKVVAPELYMAFGVSGAIQHLAGMRDSKVIVAVNKDPDAPIFQVADYGLVADLFEVIPELIEKIPEKK